MSTLQAFLNHPIESLERALHVRKQIAQLQKELSALFGTHPPALAGVQLIAPRRRGKRKMSAEGRARIAAAQLARWAKVKGRKPAAVKAVPAAKKKKKKRHLSPEARARIVAAVKARWAREKKRTSRKARQEVADAGQPKFKIF